MAAHDLKKKEKRVLYYNFTELYACTYTFYSYCIKFIFLFGLWVFASVVDKCFME